MYKNTKKAFTLVELIVVIIILAILWTIAFISLQWYSKNSRDSVRVSDMSRIKTSLELFHIGAWKYPLTTDWNIISYTWAELWNQWTFWKPTFTAVWKLDKIPLDPLTDKQYTYSVLNTKQEYEISGLVEWDDVWFNDSLFDTYAWETTAYAKVTWNYNWQVAKITKLWTTFVLALPSIITTNPWADLDLQDLINDNQLVFTNYKNLPWNYSNSRYNAEWEWTDFNLVNTGSLVVFQWSLSNLLWEDDSYRVWMIAKLKLAYTWTAIENQWWIKTILTTLSTDTNAIKKLGLLVVNNSLGWEIAIKWDVIIDWSFADYVISEIVWWLKLNIGFTWEVVTWYVNSEVAWWICFESSCGASVWRNWSTWVLSWYALSEVFWWMKMDWVIMSDLWELSWYAKSEIIWHVQF